MKTFLSLIALLVTTATASTGTVQATSQLSVKLQNVSFANSIFQTKIAGGDCQLVLERSFEEGKSKSEIIAAMQDYSASIESIEMEALSDSQMSLTYWVAAGSSVRNINCLQNYSSGNL